MANRITGDFDSEAIEAFRQAYANSMANPEEHDIDPLTNLPSNTISNTSPWLEHTGLWKANDGMSRDFKPNQPFNLDDHLPPLEEEPSGTEASDNVDEVEESFDDDADEVEVMTEEEFQALTQEVWDDEDPSSEVFDEEDEDTFDEEGESLEEDEIDALINQILGGWDDDDDEEYEDEDEDEYEDDDEEYEDEN